MNHKEIERWHRLRNIKRAAQILVVVVLVFLVSVYAVSRIVGPEPDDIGSPGEVKSGIRIDNFSFSSPGIHPWDLRAAGAQVSDTLDRVVLKDFKVVYRGGEGGNIVLRADSGELDRATRNFSAGGNVTVTQGDFQFKTSEISYSEDKGLVQSSSLVHARGPSTEISGMGLKVWVKREEVELEQDVTVILYNVNLFNPGRKLPF